MIFAYGKSPLGPILRFVRVAPVAFCIDRKEAEDVATKLREVLPCRICVLRLSDVEGLYRSGLVDADSLDMTVSGVEYVVLAEWI